jgi:hypothetical protein
MFELLNYVQFVFWKVIEAIMRTKASRIWPSGAYCYSIFVLCTLHLGGLEIYRD